MDDETQATLTGTRLPGRGGPEPLLARALHGLDEHGRLPEEILAALRALPSETRRQLASDPESLLPPFEALPEVARRAVVAAVAAADQWRTRGFELGRPQQAALRAFWALRRVARGAPAPLRHAADTLAFSVRSAPAFAIDRAASRLQAHRGRRALRPELLPWLRAAGIDPRRFALGWARGLRQAPPYRGYWHEPADGHTVCMVLGFDLIPGSDGFWFCESNMGVAQRPERTALYERDPFVANLLSHASDHGHKRLLLLDNNADGIDAQMASQYRQGAKDRKIALSLVEQQGHSAQARSYGLPPLGPEPTLAVRIKYLPTTLDWLLNHKRASTHVLQRYAADHHEPELRVPSSGPEPTLGDARPDEPLPNVVFKLPDLDAARGLVFLKVASAEEARALVPEALAAKNPRGVRERLVRLMYDDPDGIFQPYVRPPVLPDGRLYVVRAHVLLSPCGHRFLSAHRVVSRHPLPQHLPPGIVSDPTPFLVNFSDESDYALVPDDELERVEATSLAIARGLGWAVERAFEVGPSPPQARSTAPAQTIRW